MSRGMAAMIAVLMVAIAGIFVLAGWQARLLVGVYRVRSVADSLAATYAAESEIYDWVARFMGDFPNLFDPELTGVARTLRETTLADGTRLKVVGRAEGNTEYLAVGAARQFATTNIDLIRTTETEDSGGFDEVEIVVAVDCTTSMNSPAEDPADLGKTRFEAAEEAVVNFISAVRSREDADKFKMGVVTFAMDARWLMAPSSNLSDLQTAVSAGFGETRGESPACAGLLDNTSVGTALGFMNNYFATTPPTFENTKRVQLVVTDGESNSRVPSGVCSYYRQTSGAEMVSTLCPWQNSFCTSGNAYGWTCDQVSPGNYVSGERCQVLSRMFLACNMATEEASINYEGTGLGSFDDRYLDNLGSGSRSSARSRYRIDSGVGRRDAAIDLYAVTVFAGLTEQERNIFSDFSTQYYYEENAANLTEVLEGILTEIEESLTTITIKRIVPTPIR